MKKLSNPSYDNLFSNELPIVDVSKINPYVFETGAGLAPRPLYTPDKSLTSGTKVGESQYDITDDQQFLTNPNAINRNRASQQPEYVKGFNAVVGGILSGLMTSGQDISYIADIENGVKRLTGAAEVEENWLSSAAIQGKNYLNTNMPIYTQDPSDVWNWRDSGSYWGALKGIIDSAVGFAIPGMAAGKLMSVGVRGARTLSFLNGLITANRAEKITALGAGFMTNYAEGKMMALESYENSLNALKKDYYNTILGKYIKQVGEFSQYKTAQDAADAATLEFNAAMANGKEEEFKEIAGAEADKFQRNNMVFMLSDAVGLHGLFKGVTKGAPRNIINKETLKNYFLGMNADNFLVQGVKEGAEEIGQEVMQREAEYQAAKQGGIDTGEPDDLLERVIKFGTSESALVQGAMGFLGGPLQRVMTKGMSGQYGNKYNQSIEEQITKQENQIKANQDFLQTKFNTYKTGNDIIAAAESMNEAEISKMVKDNLFATKAADNFATGTTQAFEDELVEITKLTPEQAKAKGYSDDYASKAESMITELRELEKEWNKTSAYTRPSEIFENRQTRKLFNNLYQITDNKLNTAKNNVIQFATPYVAEGVNLSNDSFEKQHFSDDKDINNRIINSPEFKEYQSLNDKLHTISQEVKKIDDAYDTLTSIEFQQKDIEAAATVKTMLNEADSNSKRNKKKKRRKKIYEEISQKKAIEKQETLIKESEENDNIDVSNLGEEYKAPNKDMFIKEEPEAVTKEALKEPEIKIATDVPIEKNDIKAYQGYNDTLDDREINYFTLDEEEAKDYGKNVREVSIDTKNFIKAKDNKKFDTLSEEFYNTKGKRFDVLDNSAEGLITQGQFFNFIKSKGYSGIDMSGYTDTKYLISFDNKVVTTNTKPQREIIHSIESTIESESYNDQYTYEKNEDIEKETTSIEQDIIEASGNISDVEDGNPTYEYDRIEYGNNALAYLARQYKKVYDYATGNIRKVDIDNFIDESILDKSILGNKKLQVGDNITLRVDSSNDIKVYNGTNNEKVTWDEYSKLNNIQVNSEEWIKTVPIAVYDNTDKKVAYIHTTDWITSDNVYGDVEEDRKYLHNIRKYVIDNNGFTTIIEDRSLGKLFKTSDNKNIPLNEAMPNPDLVIGIGKDNILQINKGESGKFSEEVINKSITNGTLYAVVNAKDKKLAIPLNISQLGDADISLITDAIRIYATNSINDGLRKDILNITGYDITTPAGIDSFLQMYVNNFKLPEDGFIPGKSTKHIISINNGSISFGIGGDSVESLDFINQKTDAKMLNILMDKLSKHLSNMYYNVSLTHLNNKNSNIVRVNKGNIETLPYNSFIKSVLSTNVLNVNIGTDDNPEYTSFIQPVIRFNTKEINEEINITLPTNTEKESPVINKTEESKDEYSEFYLNDNVDEMPDSYINELSESSKLIYSEDLGAAKQKQIVDYVRGKIIGELFINESINKSELLDSIKEEYKSLVDKATNALNKATEEGNTNAASKINDYINEINKVLDSWDIISRISMEQVNRINGINSSFDLDEDEDNDESYQDKQDSYDDNKSLTMDGLSKLSVKVKRMLGGIKRVDATGKPVTNYLRQEMDMSFDIVYNTLQSITANTDPDINVMLYELEQYKDKFPWITQVIDLLKNSSEDVVNGFVTGMTNHTHNMKFIMWSRNSDGTYRLVEYDSNSNSIAEATKSLWKNNMLYDSEIGIVNPDGQIVGNKDVIAQHTAMMDEWITGNIPSDSTVKTWLNTIGIELSDNAFDKLKNEKIKGNTYKEQFTNSSGIFKIINNNLKQLSNNVIETSTFFSDNAVKQLAKIESEFNIQLNPSSFRAGTKTIFTYGNNKLLVNQVRRLKGITKINDNIFTSKEVTERLETAFTRNSYWLNDMLVLDADGNPIQESNGEYRVNPNSSFMRNLNHGVVSLEAIKQMGAQSKDNSELYKLSPMEIEVFKLGELQATRADLSGNNKRIIATTYPTTSDKTNVYMIQSIGFDAKYNTEGDVTDNTLDRLYDILVLPELERIVSFQALDLDNRPNNKAYSGGKTGDNAGADKFILFPEFNNIEGLFNKNGKISPDAYNEEFKKEFKYWIKRYIDELVNEKLEFWNTVGIGATVKDKNGKVISVNSFLNNEFISKAQKEGYGFAKENTVRFAATDMVVQYLVSNAEAFKMFIGDPAQFWKPKSNSQTLTKQIEDTFENIGKRLAADIAPGTELSGALNDEYIQIIAEDSKLTSKEYHNRLNRILTKSDLSKYGRGSDVRSNDKDNRADATDAQEYTTWREHVKVLHMMGRLNTKQLEDITDALSNDKNLSYEQLKLVLQPLKPVYADNYNINGGLRNRMYIKSSSFPLIKQLTEGLELDKVRIAMEELENEATKTVRLAYSTAVKVGTPRELYKVWDDNGNVVDGLSFIPKENESAKWVVLNRRGFRIQQDVPYDPNKSEIREVTQASKNLFVNILNIDGFKVDWIDKELSGRELRDIYNNLHGELYKIGLRGLKKELLSDNGLVDIKKLKILVEEEAIKRGYNISDRLLIRLDNDLSFLPFSSVASKYQAILNALVYNRVIKQKIRGKSFVLGSSQGFKQITGTEGDKYINETSGIIFTDSWKGELMPTGGTEDVVTPLQVLIPWKFKDSFGNKLHIEDFISKETGRIDFNRLPQDVLMGFGMRIPNQGLNSQVVFEIVGFLPELSGDLLIANEDLVVQMGSDFDVDKLYTYLYNTSYNPKTKTVKKIILDDSEIKDLYDKRYGKDDATDNLLRTIFGEEYDKAITERYESFRDKVKEKVLQNQIIDTHRAVHMNPDRNIQAAISQPLGTWLLEDIAKDITNAKSKRNAGKLFTGLSESYQTSKFIQAVAGKSGVGIFSLDSMFNALLQNTGAAFPSTTKNPFRIAFGNRVSKGRLDMEKTLSGEYYTSDVIAGYQSGAVDNEKLQVLDKLNINSETFGVIRLLNQLGFGEETLWFIAQDIIFDYVKELKKLKGSLGGFIANADKIAYDNVLKNSKYSTDFENDDMNNYLEPGLSTLKSLVLYDTDENNAPIYPPNYAKYQVALLNKFISLSPYVDALSDLQRAINVDSKGFGKSLIESSLREEQFFRAINSPILNSEKLFGDILNEEPKENINDYVYRRYDGENYWIKPTTIPGLAVVHGLFENNDLWNQVFPLSTESVRNTMKEVESIIGREDKSFQAKSDLRFDVWNTMKSYLFSSSDSLFGDADIQMLRERLTKDKYSNKEITLANGTITTVKEFTNKSLATIVNELKTSSLLKNNSFIQRLNFRKDSTNPNYPSLIEYNASSKEGIDETALYIDFVDLFIRDRALGIYNGIEYTTKMLAEELVKYAYLTGGNQGAIEFLKIIPPAYLKSIGFMNEISSIDLDDLSVFQDSGDSESLPYYSRVSTFTQQYVQHNPGKIREKLNEELKQITDITKSNNKIDSFRLNTKEESTIGLYRRYPGIKDAVPPVYLVLYDNKEAGKYLLFKFNGDKYNRIPVLGAFGASEYEYGASFATSVYNTNSNPVVVTNDYNKYGVKDIPSNTIFDKLEVKSTTNGKHQLEKILTNISLDGGFNGFIADIILKEYSRNNSLIPEFNLNLSDNIESFGKWNSDTQELLINKDAIKNYNNSEITNKLLHEIIHIITVEDLNKSIREGIDTIKDTKKRKAIVHLNSVLRTYKEYLENTYADEYKEYKNKIDLYKKSRTGDKTAESKYIEHPFTERELGLFYSTENIKEFVAQVLSNPMLQEELNSIPDKEISLFEKIKKILVDLLQSIFNFNFDSDSLLATALNNAIDLIESNNDIIETQSTSNNQQLDLFNEPEITLFDNPLNTFKFKDGKEVETGIKLNSQQEDALQLMADFFNDKKEFFTLQGYAGTGKTTIIKFLVDYIHKKSFATNIVFSSPTHRANAVLKQSLKGEKVKTLHSLFGLSPEQDLETFDITTAKFTKQRDTLIGYGDLLIIDESSLINNSLYEFIVKASSDIGVRVIFMGDPAQIKPVGQSNLSKVFNDVKDSYSLTKVERTGDNPLLKEITDIRNSNSNDPLSYISDSNNDDEGVTYSNSQSLIYNIASDMFSSDEFIENPLLVRVVSGTNYNVEEVNKLIRKGKYPYTYDNEYNVGDILMGYDNFDVNYRTKEPLIINSGDYIVEDVSEQLEEDFLKMKVKYYNLTLRNALNTDSPEIRVKMLSKSNPISVFNSIAEEYENMRLRAMEYPKGSREAAAAWAGLNAFKSTYALPKEASFNGNIKIKKTLDYGYAHTIHKSQGGTYKYIIADLRDIDKFKDIELQKQLKYVALSRAQKHAYILTNNKVKSEDKTNLSDINPSEDDIVIENLLPLGYVTRNDIEEIKRFCK